MAATRRRLRTSHQAIRPPAAMRSHRSVQWWGRRGSTTYSSTRFRSRTRSVNAPAGRCREDPGHPALELLEQGEQAPVRAPRAAPGWPRTGSPAAHPRCLSLAVSYFPSPPPLSAFPSPSGGEGWRLRGPKAGTNAGEGSGRSQPCRTRPSPWLLPPPAKRQPGGIIEQGSEPGISSAIGPVSSGGAADRVPGPSGRRARRRPGHGRGRGAFGGFLLERRAARLSPAVVDFARND